MLGVVRTTPRNPEDDYTNRHEVAVPLIYALLSSKEQIQYIAVLNAIVDAAENFNIENCQPDVLMTDFEKAIINSCDVFPDSTVSCCFFHLGQSLYRKIQEVGLQTAYNDPTDRNLKIHAHMLLALAYVPIADVKIALRLLKPVVPQALNEVIDYFAVNYITGKPKRGRIAAVPPRYPMHLWNQYEATLQGTHKTNNISEGWHNRFRLLVGKNHPDLYSLLLEFKKEQSDTESIIADLNLGKNVKAAPKKKWITIQNRLRTVASSYLTYKRDREILHYLKAIGSNIIL